jgi:CspA family cold shock protein
MLVGIVKWFNIKKGFGFIVDETTKKDVFVHFTVIEGDGYRRLWQDEKVEYEMTSGPKGLLATRVRHLSLEGRQPDETPLGDEAA